MIGGCVRWCSSSRAGLWWPASSPSRSPVPARSWSRSTPAASAAPTSTWSTATCASRSCPWSSGTRSSARSRGRGRGPSASPPGERVGIPWLGWTDGECRYCRSGRENLCERARFTGYQLDGGYAELAVADERYCFPIPEGYPDLQAAPLLCAGLIGYRSLRLCGDAERIGFYGFGASAHIVCQVAAHEGRRVFALTRPGDAETQRFALELGAAWAGDTEGGSEVSEPGEGLPPEPLDAAIIFAPAGELVPVALRAVAPGRDGGLRRAST